MENILLIVQLIVAILLIAVVMLQRSEGGALGMGGGGGGGLVSSRGAATALTKLTWILAIIFIALSLVMTVLASGGQEQTNIFDTTSGQTTTDPAQIPLPNLGDAPVLPSLNEESPSGSN